MFALRAGNCCATAHQGKDAVADAAVTCVAVLMVVILCFQFGVFLSLINPSRAERRLVSSMYLTSSLN